MKKQGFFAYTLSSMVFLGPLTTIGCGKAEEKLPVSGSEISPSDSGIIGLWDGILITKSAIGTIENPKPSGIQEVPVTMKIEGKSDKEGAFAIILKNVENAIVKGSFRNFAGKSLILSITDSNVSYLGLNGSNTDLPYELTGNSLLFSNEKMTLKLTKIVEKDKEKETPGEANSAAVGVFSRWKCQDSNNKVWVLNIKPDKTFNLDIASEKTSRKFLWLDGRIEISNDRDFLLIAEDSNNEKYRGLKLVGELLDLNRVVLRRSANDAQSFESVNCSRN